MECLIEGPAPFSTNFPITYINQRNLGHSIAGGPFTVTLPLSGRYTRRRAWLPECDDTVNYVYIYFNHAILAVQEINFHETFNFAKKSISTNFMYPIQQ